MKRVFILILLNLLFAAFAVGQGTIRGTLFDDANGEAIPFANVVLDGTKMGCATDLSGFFLINKIPNGTYTLKAYAKSSGSINQSYIYVKGYGGADKQVTVKDAGSNWKEVTIPDIQVTGGKCEVGIYTDAKAGAWIKTDDFTLIGKSRQDQVADAQVAHIKLVGDAVYAVAVAQ